ncbi:hypothetical protein FA047_17795 [Pedobacter frigoris]|uniref:Uncharacterized protein n=2 Tax=Pedobacter frigoris TaxID=2571272 RepID=A0A4U1CFT2_9SPHI|nr:hypothetical protein FA047_17795 [Pedobacter frigoris]
MMMQSYKNHIRYYAPHHFVFYPIVGILIAITVRQAIVDEANSLLWIFLSISFLMLGWLSFMVRQHYALTLQNRGVVLEMRFRYYTLTGRRLEPLEEHLSFGQIAALRFASDEELPGLVERTLKEQLSSGQIKKAIENWLPDNSRV